MPRTEHEFVVTFSWRGHKDGADYLVGQVTSDTWVRFAEYELAKSVFHRFGPRVGDLIRIALSVFAVDRMARRDWRRDSGGSRVIRLGVNVTDPDFWRDGAVIQLLPEVMELVGSDTWHFEFYGCEPEFDYLYTDEGSAPRVCMYSGGLDSVAGLARILHQDPSPILAVTTGHQALQCRRVIEHTARLSARYGADLRPIIPRAALVNPPEWKRQESTQRCRSFLFAAIAGAVACAEGSSEVMVLENGVGAVNVPLMPGMAVGARTTKSSHPRFLRLMSDILSGVAGRRIDYVLPHRGRTKAELVRALAEDGLSEVALSSVSCVHYPVRAAAKQCGYCPACIGRRQAMLSGGINEPNGTYQYDLFGQRQLVNAVPNDKLDALKANLLQIEDLRELEDGGTPDWFLQYALGTGVEEHAESLEPWADLWRRYRNEWLELISFGRSRGWRWAHWLSPCVAA